MVEGFNKAKSLKLKVESDFDLMKKKCLSKWYRVTIPQSFSVENASPLCTRGPDPSGKFFAAGASPRPTVKWQDCRRQQATALLAERSRPFPAVNGERYFEKFPYNIIKNICNL